MAKLTERLENYDRDAKRVKRGDEVVGMALRLTNGRWAAFDRDERRLSSKSFAIPHGVLLWRIKNGYAADPAGRAALESEAGR